MADFEWDAVKAFGPYTTNEIIDDSMGIQFKGDNGGIERIENRFLLVFANGKNAVKTVVLSRLEPLFIVLDVPEDSASIHFGVLLIGKGKVCSDGFRFEEVTEKVPTTNMLDVEHLPKQPRNLDFSE